MNNDQMISLLSTLLKIAGTAVVAHGTLGINGAAWEQISGGVLMLAPIIYDYWHHTDANRIASVAAIPDVSKIVIKAAASDGTLAAATNPDMPKVVMTTPAIAAAITAATKTS